MNTLELEQLSLSKLLGVTQVMCDMNQNTLGEALGPTQITISHWRREKHSPSKRQVKIIRSKCYQLINENK